MRITNKQIDKIISSNAENDTSQTFSENDQKVNIYGPYIVSVAVIQLCFMQKRPQAVHKQVCLF